MVTFRTSEPFINSSIGGRARLSHQQQSAEPPVRSVHSDSDRDASASLPLLYHRANFPNHSIYSDDIVITWNIFAFVVGRPVSLFPNHNRWAKLQLLALLAKCFQGNASTLSNFIKTFFLCTSASHAWNFSAFWRRVGLRFAKRPGRVEAIHSPIRSIHPNIRNGWRQHRNVRFIVFSFADAEVFLSMGMKGFGTEETMLSLNT